MPILSIKYPFSFGAHDDVAVSVGIARYREMIMQVIATPIGSRRANPEFGSRVQELMFENDDHLLETLGRVYVIEAIERWISSITITAVGIESRDEEQNGSKIHVTQFAIRYLIESTGEEDEFTFGLANG